MFEGFAKVWTPVMLARAVGRKPVRFVLAGTPIVLFRGADRRIGALVDRCPHRGVALSLGHVGYALNARFTAGASTPPAPIREFR